MSITQKLQDKILTDGYAKGTEILKVDSFINHQVDPVFMDEIGADIAAHYAEAGITKVLTIESSGISPALMTAKHLNVPMVILKKQPSAILNDNLYHTQITSFTKEVSYELCMSKEFINENDHVLIVDDFLANGEAAIGALRLIRQAHATVAGLSVIIEKSFQPGHEKIASQGIDVYPLVKIASLNDSNITFA